MRCQALSHLRKFDQGCVALCLQLGNAAACGFGVHTLYQSRAGVGSVRARVAVALKAAARLQALGYIDASGKGTLKEMVFGGNSAVFRCVQNFEEDGDGDALVEALLRLAA